MIYEDLLALWLAYLIWELLPTYTSLDLALELKLFLFLGKEIFFFFSLLFWGRRALFWKSEKNIFLERLFILIAFALFVLDLLFFNFKRVFSAYYFAEVFIIFWFLHYYFFIKFVFYRLNFQYFRILLGLYLPFFILILADNFFELLDIHFPGKFVLLLLGILALSPYLVIKIWPVRRIPEGYLRELLSRFFKSLDLKMRDYLILPRIGAKFYTAGVLGFIPPFRYLFFSEGLLEVVSPEEILGILAHEAGHLKKKHGLLLFLLLLTFPLSLLNSLYFFLLIFSFFFENPEEIGEFLKGPYGVYFDLALALYLFFYAVLFFRVIFAYILRSLEREADLYALSVLKDPSSLISSLYKIGTLTGQLYRKSWHHYGLWERIHFLRYASENPQVIKRHSLKLRKFFLLWVLLNLLLVVLFTYLGADVLERVLKIFLG